MGHQGSTQISAQEMEEDLDSCLQERYHILGWGKIGPLTLKQTVEVQRYEDYMDLKYKEYLAQEAAGGRKMCQRCGERAVKTRTVCTLGYVGHPGADYSALEECGNCGYKDLA